MNTAISRRAERSSLPRKTVRHTIMRSAIIAVLILTGSGVALTPVRAAPTAAASAALAESRLHGPVTIAGRWLIDATGRVTTFHGSNVVDKTPPYTPEHYGFDDRDADFLVANGFNAIRLGITWEAVEPRPGQINYAYLARTKRFVERMADHGLSTIVEYHQDKYSRALTGEGAPAWATITDGLPNLDQNLLLAQVSPAIFAAFHNFFFNAKAPDGVGIQDHFINVWRATSRTLVGTRGLLAYGILNEPGQGIPVDICVQTPHYCPPDAATRLRGFLDRTGDVIRSIDRVTPMIESPYVLSAAGVVLGEAKRNKLRRPANAGVAFGFNSYAVPCILGLRVPVVACRGLYEQTHEEFRGYQRDYNLPVILTEFGATDMADTLDYQTALADRGMLSWFQWNYGGNDPSTTAPHPTVQGLLGDARRPPTGNNINYSNLRALSRIYPEVVAGTPLNWSYDPRTDRFVLNYTTRKVDGTGSFPAGSLTRISIPRIHFAGRDYKVSVTGGEVAARTPGTLVISANATSVSVTVEPR